MEPPPSPAGLEAANRQVIQERLVAATARQNQLITLVSRVSNSRLGVFAAGVGVLWTVTGPRILGWGWLAVPIGVFLWLVLFHDRLLWRRKRATQAMEFYSAALARMDGRWQDLGAGGKSFQDAAHPYASDLDLFGTHSLFQLMSAAQTRGGEAVLARWMKETAPPASVSARQTAARELCAKLDLREALYTLGSDVKSEIDVSVLTHWGTQPPVLTARWIGPVAWLLAAGAVVGVGGWAWLDWGPLPLMGIAALEFLVGNHLKEELEWVTGAVSLPGRQLKALSDLIARIQAEPLQTAQLVEIQQGLGSAAKRIDALGSLVGALDQRKNQIFAIVAWLLMWTVHCALALERWRRTSGPQLGAWLHMVGDLEALTSVAQYTYEHAEDPLPEIIDTPQPMVEAREMGHPLLPRATCVRNDLQLGGERAVLLVSGSNMSGKSTMLRTVGINVVLAQLGAPVRARSLKLTPVQLATSIQISDSLEAGASRFYAEITRIKQVLDLTATGPVLFLLDEVLHGTNSHDRQIGAEAIVRALVERGAVGMVTTHDLAVAKLTETMKGVVNTHFEDQMVDGKLVFDYRMKEGVVTHSNAIALMRAIGLPV